MGGNPAVREAIVHDIVILVGIGNVVLQCRESFLGNNSTGIP